MYGRSVDCIRNLNASGSHLIGHVTIGQLRLIPIIRNQQGVARPVISGHIREGGKERACAKTAPLSKPNTLVTECDSAAAATPIITSEIASRKKSATTIYIYRHLARAMSQSRSTHLTPSDGSAAMASGFARRDLRVRHRCARSALPQRAASPCKSATPSASQSRSRSLHSLSACLLKLGKHVWIVRGEEYAHLCKTESERPNQSSCVFFQRTLLSATSSKVPTRWRIR